MTDKCPCTKDICAGVQMPAFPVINLIYIDNLMFFSITPLFILYYITIRLKCELLFLCFLLFSMQKYPVSSDYMPRSMRSDPDLLSVICPPLADMSKKQRPRDPSRGRCLKQIQRSAQPLVKLRSSGNRTPPAALPKVMTKRARTACPFQTPPIQK